jgi:rfaE bifunctional protein nucleotidyltransferase chain/domain
MSVIWVNGCFDVLHVGHIKLFEYAKSMGDKLVVGIDSDNRVKQLKGDDRPINTEEDRKEMLMSIKYIDSVVIFDTEQELIDNIKKLKPKLMVVGEDYRFKDVVGEEFSQGVGFFKRVVGYSTTNIVSGQK